MSNLSLKTIGRRYAWLILLALAIIIFVMLRSPAAGDQQSSQNRSADKITDLEQQPDLYGTVEDQEGVGSTDPSDGQEPVEVTPPTSSPTPPVYEPYPRKPIFCPDSQRSESVQNSCSPCESTWPERNHSMVCVIYD